MVSKEINSRKVNASKVLVIYDSQTGSTEKMAQAVVKGVQQVKGVEVELLKVGTPFSISKLAIADALILGSPTRYGNVTSEMRLLLESLTELKESKKLKLSGKIGGVFGSYGWAGGWVVEKLKEDLIQLGIKIVAPAVSLVHEPYVGSQINEETLTKCVELGKTVAEKLAK